MLTVALDVMGGDYAGGRDSKGSKAYYEIGRASCRERV